MAREYIFGLGPGHLSEAARTAAGKRGAEVVNFTEPDGYERHWYTCDNLGDAYTSRVSYLTLEAVELLGAKAKK
jgi:hypothetical protein